MEETCQRLQLHSLIRFFNILDSILDFCPTLLKKMYFLIHHYISKQASAKNCAFKIPKKKPGCTGRSCRDSPMWLWGVFYGHQHWGHKEKELFVKIPQRSSIYRRHCRQEISRGRCTAEVDYIQRWKVKLVEQKSKFALFNESYKRKFLQLVEMQKTNPE